MKKAKLYISELLPELFINFLYNILKYLVCLKFKRLKINF